MSSYQSLYVVRTELLSPSQVSVSLYTSEIFNVCRFFPWDEISDVSPHVETVVELKSGDSGRSLKSGCLDIMFYLNTTKSDDANTLK